jgi:hypothetical protein
MVRNFLRADVQPSKRMTLCDPLEQPLSRTVQQRRRLLAALLQEALAGRLDAEEENHADIA